MVPTWPALVACPAPSTVVWPPSSPLCRPTGPTPADPAPTRAPELAEKLEVVDTFRHCSRHQRNPAIQPSTNAASKDGTDCQKYHFTKSPFLSVRKRGDSAFQSFTLRGSGREGLLTRLNESSVLNEGSPEKLPTHPTRCEQDQAIISLRVFVWEKTSLYEVSTS